MNEAQELEVPEGRYAQRLIQGTNRSSDTKGDRSPDHLHPLKSSSFEDTQREELRGMLVAQAEIWHIDLDMDICWTVLGRNYKTILS